ncbi:MAG: O-antigen ligase family protein [Waterburya sp.]
MISIKQHKSREKNTFFSYYQRFLALAAILVFFTNVNVFLGGYGIGIPLLWLILFLVISIPLYILKLSSKNKFRYIPVSIIVWCAFYIGISSISLLISQYVPMQSVEDLIRSLLFFITMIVIFSQSSLEKKWIKITILLITFMNVFIHIYEFLNPLAFALVKDAEGRAAGFYIDANTASFALIVGMIFTIDLFKPKYRLFYALFVFMGIALTFSRGGMACWVLVMLSFFIIKIVPLGQLPLILLSMLITATIVSTQLKNLSYIKSADGSELFSDGTITRIEFLLNPFNQDEEDFDDSRILLAKEAEKKFTNKPILGNGIGGARIEGFGTGDSATESGMGTHNIFLDLALRFGFLGVVIYPFLLIATVWKAPEEIQPYTRVFVIFSLAWGVFSHTLLDAFFHLTVYALVATWVQSVRVEKSLEKSFDSTQV